MFGVAVNVAGGDIGAAGFTIDPATPNIATTLKVDHVDLAEITRLIGPEGLSGTGQLDGQITLDLDKAESGEGTVLLHLEGRNPAVMSGHPFIFNIRLESNFHHLADIAMLSLRSAADLLRRSARRIPP